MKNVRKISFFWKSTILSFALLMNLVLGYSLILGDQNIFIWKNLHKKYEHLQSELLVANDQKAQLSRQIRLLQNDPIYIEQLVRQKLNYVKENEILYLFEKEKDASSFWLEGEDTNLTKNQ